MNKKYDVEQVMVKKGKSPYITILGVGLIEFLISSIFLNYGVFLIHFIFEDFYRFETGIWTVIFLVTAQNFAKPWCQSYCKYLDVTRHETYKRNVLAALTLWILVNVLIVITRSATCHILLYGLTGGITTIIVSTHLEYWTKEILESWKFQYFIISEICHALNLLLMPYLLLHLLNFYGKIYTHIIYAAITLNVIPVLMVIKSKKGNSSRLNRFQTLSTLSSEILDLNIIKKEQKSEVEKCEVNLQSCISANIVLLPIPEEDESAEEQEVTVENNDKSDSHQCVESIVHLRKKNQFYEYFHNTDRIFYCQWKRKRTKEFFIYNFSKPLLRSLSDIYFYPLLYSNVITISISTVYLASIPFITSREDAQLNFLDAVFLLSVIAFGWMVSLTGFPIIGKLSVAQVRFIFLIGLVSAFGSLFLINSMKNEFLTLACLMFGFGFGIVNYCKVIVYTEFIGNKRWKKLQGPLQTLTATTIIILYSAIYISNVKLRYLLSFSHWAYSSLLTLWILGPITKMMVLYLYKGHEYRLEHHYHSYY